MKYFAFINKRKATNWRSLYDHRFIDIIKILQQHNEPIKALYAIRLVTGFGLASARKYTYRLEKFRAYGDRHISRMRKQFFDKLPNNK